MFTTCSWIVLTCTPTKSGLPRAFLQLQWASGLQGDSESPRGGVSAVILPGPCLPLPLAGGVHCVGRPSTPHAGCEVPISCTPSESLRCALPVVENISAGPAASLLVVSARPLSALASPGNLRRVFPSDQSDQVPRLAHDTTRLTGTLGCVPRCSDTHSMESIASSVFGSSVVWLWSCPPP